MMKTKLLMVAAALAACASLAHARDVSIRVSYPVPALPLDGWSYASVVLARTTTRDTEFTLFCSPYRRGVTVQKSGVLRDNRPRRYPFVFRVSEDQFNSSPVCIRIGDETSSWGDLQFGRSVVGLTASPGRVLGRIQQLDAVMQMPQSYWAGAWSVVIVEHRDARLLPNTWKGYDLLQAMVMEDFPYSELTPAQSDAIVQWVEKGGTVLVSPGARGMVFDPASPLHRLVGLKLEGTERIENTRDFGSGGPRGIFTRWNVEIEGARHEPWAEVARCGAGQVVVFKYDFLRPPLSEWKGLTGIFKKTCRIPVRVKPDRHFPLYFSRQEEQLPGPPTIALLLGVYLLAVGPANYMLLRRKNKLVLMPFTISGVAVGFTVAIIAYGYISRGAATEMREFTVVRTYPGRTTAYATTQKGVFAGSNRTFVFEFGANAGVRMFRKHRRDESQLFITDTGRGTQEARFTAAMWQLSLLREEAPVPEFGNLRIERKDGQITIFNDTPLDLENCWVRTDGGAWHRIGKLPRGGSTPDVGLQGRPPSAVLNAVGVRSRGALVIGRAAAGSDPAIPCKMIQGRASLKQNEMYIVGGEL